jgi:hypothetical protein
MARFQSAGKVLLFICSFQLEANFHINPLPYLQIKLFTDKEVTEKLLSFFFHIFHSQCVKGIKRAHINVAEYI